MSLSVKRTVSLALLLSVAGAAAWAHWPQSPLPNGTRADRVVVRKTAHTLQLYRGKELVRTYSVALGRNPLGAKDQQGDGRTPEGLYVLDYRNASSGFHKALHISYPSLADQASARSRRVDAGGLIMVHGVKNGLGFLGRFHSAIDWTDGCIAVTDRDIDEIWRVVPDRTPIQIEP